MTLLYLIAFSILLPLSFNLSSDAYAIISPVDETCAKVTLTS